MPRYVGSPESAERPAPVTKSTLRLLFNRRAMSAICSSSTRFGYRIIQGIANRLSSALPIGGSHLYVGPMFFTSEKKIHMPTPEQALPGRDTEMPVAARHFVLDAPLRGPFPEDTQQAMFGLGCFWGAERKFWQREGVYTTAAGYAAGSTPNPTYEEVCSGLTGHNEVVLVVYRPAEMTYEELLKVFWESHDPTQGMKQGNDVGTQYRSGVYYFDDAQHQSALASKKRYGEALGKAGYGRLTTEVIAAPPFYYAEDYHQQYLAKNPSGYCGLGGTGVGCPT